MRAVHFIAAAAATLACSLPAAATTSAITGDGSWHEFASDQLAAASGGLEWVDTDTLAAGYGSAMTFSFTIAQGQQGVLTVVDNAFAGDRFAVTNNGRLLGLTSAVPARLASSAPFEFDFNAALAQPGVFSSKSFALGAGTYLIGGSMIQSVLADDLTPLNASSGGLRLEVSPVPEPGSLLLMMVGVAALMVRRRLGSD